MNAATKLHTFTNEADGVAAHVFSVGSTFNVTIQDIDSGEYLPSALVGIKTEEAAIAVAKHSVNL